MSVPGLGKGDPRCVGGVRPELGGAGGKSSKEGGAGTIDQKVEGGCDSGKEPRWPTLRVSIEVWRRPRARHPGEESMMNLKGTVCAD